MRSAGTSRWVRAATWATALVPAFFAFNYVFRFAVDVLVHDDWDLVPLLEKSFAGAVTLGDLFAQHNEHRLLFPRLLMLAAAHVTGRYTLVMAYASWTFVLATALALLAHHVRVHGWSSKSAVLFLPIAWMTFSLRQADDLLWGWNVQITLANAAAIGALVIASHATSWRGFLAAVALAAIASYSYGAGFVAWPAGALAWWRAPLRRADAARLVSWLAAGAIVLALYLLDYSRPAHHPNPFLVAQDPVHAAHALAITLGVAFSSEPLAAALFGAFELAVLASLLVFHRRRLGDVRVRCPSALALAGAAAAAMVVAGRAGFGEDGVLQSRYACLVLPVSFAAYQLALLVEAKGRVPALAAAACLAGLTLLGSYRGAIRYGLDWRATKRAQAEILASYRDRSDEQLSGLYPAASVVRERAPMLERRGLSVFSRE